MSPAASLDLPPASQLSAEVATLADGAHELAEASRSNATRRAYESDWRDFTNFCDRHDYVSLPADAAVVALYLTDMATTRGLAVSTIQRRASSISVAHTENSHDSPTANPAVRRILQGIRRVNATEKATRKPVSLADLRRMVATCNDSAKGRRDRAILLVGFVGGMRRSELTALNVGDLTEHDAGLKVHIRHSKTDQEGSGRTIALPFAANQDLCPVTALKTWIGAADIERGAIFRQVHRGDHVGSNRLSAQSVSLVVKRRAEAAGLDSNAFSGHSLRSGFATTAAENGASERAIARQTGHKSIAVLRGYVRPAQVFQDNAATELGL